MRFSRGSSRSYRSSYVEASSRASRTQREKQQQWRGLGRANGTNLLLFLVEYLQGAHLCFGSSEKYQVVSSYESDSSQCIAPPAHIEKMPHLQARSGESVWASGVWVSMPETAGCTRYFHRLRCFCAVFARLLFPFMFHFISLFIPILFPFLFPVLFLLL